MEEIDNTLIEDEINTISDDEVNGYETNKSKTKIKFSKKMHRKNIGSIKVDDYKITWGLDNFDNKSEAIIQSKNEQEDQRLKVFEDITQTVIYEDILENLSLRYSIDSLKIKEDIIIQDKIDNPTFTFNYKVKNLKLTLNNNGEIEARNTLDEVIFIMPKPYMVDTNNNRSEDVTYTINQENDNKYTITITADSEWMNDENRVYPIVIDPVIIENNASAFESTFITSNQSDNNWSQYNDLLVGNEYSEYGFCRALITVFSRVPARTPNRKLKP